MKIYNTQKERELFFKYIDENCLNPQTVHYILERANSVEESISKSVIAKYEDLYKVYLVADNFRYNNGYGVDGVKGYIMNVGHLTSIQPPVCKQNDQFFFDGKRKLFQKYPLPDIREFDTLLVMGCYDELSSLAFTKMNLIMGGILSDTEMKQKENYISLCEYINRKHSIEYELVTEPISEVDKELYLIRKKR